MAELINSQANSLSQEQSYLKKKVGSGESMVVTGKAGTGKSRLLEEIRDCLPLGKYATTAPTGAAAVRVNATTFHSFIGCGLANGKVEDLLKKQSPIAKMNIMMVQVLIIDEFYMVSADFWNRAEQIVQRVRNNKLPFGGIQVIAFGDPLQIPPVNKKIYATDPDILSVFTSPRYEALFGPRRYELTEVFRQREPEFIELLEDLRRGTFSEKTLRTIAGLRRPLDTSDGIKPTRLFCTKAKVDACNMTELYALEGDISTYTAVDDGIPAWVQYMNEHARLPQTLYLRIGAQVMHLVNDKALCLVNGSRGVVTGYENGNPRVRFVGNNEHVIKMTIDTVEDRTGKVLASRMQVPLMLAWACTIHKSQGATMDKVTIDVAEAFEYGMVYVAASRATSLAGLQIESFDPRTCTTNPAAVEHCRTFLPVRTVMMAEGSWEEEKKESEEEPGTLKVI